MTALSGTALRLTVFVGDRDHVHHKPLYTEIVHRAHAAGLAGASVLRGMEGYGASSLIHTTRLLSLSEDLPIVVVIVDTPDKVRAFLPELEGLVHEGLIILDEVEVVRYVGRHSDDAKSRERGSSAGRRAQPTTAGHEHTTPLRTARATSVGIDNTSRRTP